MFCYLSSCSPVFVLNVIMVEIRRAVGCDFGGQAHAVYVVIDNGSIAVGLHHDHW
jgi:hypothetical protein